MSRTLTANMVEPLVSCAWLQEHWLKNRIPNVAVVDAKGDQFSPQSVGGTYNQPKWNRDAEAEFRQAHIDGAVRFNIEKICDVTNPIPLMLPSVEQFEKDVGELGIGNDTHVIIYDNNATSGMYSAGRVWWMFKVFGHDKVSILDGGLARWIADGRPTVSGEHPQIQPTTFKAHHRPHLVRDMKQMLDNQLTRKEQVIDTRSKGRFDGTAPEPEPELYSGHILGSLNVPYTTLISADTKTMKKPDGIVEAFTQAGVDLDQPTVLTCGGAVTAPLVAFAASLIGKSIPIYDGSWAEWVQKAPSDTKHIGIRGKDMK